MKLHKNNLPNTINKCYINKKPYVGTNRKSPLGTRSTLSNHHSGWCGDLPRTIVSRVDVLEGFRQNHKLKYGVIAVVDFTPILTLLLAVIPIILIVSILKKFFSGKIFIFPLLGLLTMGMTMAPMMGNFSVRAAASISPDSGTLAADIPVFFTAEGLTASTSYWVNVTVGGSTSNAGVFTSSSEGVLSFSLTFTTEGQTLVDVRSASASVVSATLNIIDLIELIMPYIVIGITLSVVLGLAAMLGKIVK